jgi:branched-chain amino acid transport system substrate-binding protein
MGKEKIGSGLEPAEIEGKAVSRRDFLKIAGVAGAVVGVGGGLGGLLAACGGGTTSTSGAATTAGGAGTTAPTAAASSTTTAAAATTTSAAVAAETGREIKIGFVTPQTGSLASFGVADKYCVEHFKGVIGDGVVMGDQKKHPINILLVDSQSNSNRSGQVAGDLINNDKVDILTAASSGDNVTPVSDQGEAYEIPTLTTDTPWQAWFNTRKGDPKVGFKWTYHAFWGQEDNFGIYFDLWKQVPNNKVAGVLWPNDVDGNSYRAKWPDPMKAQGYTIVDAGSFQDGTEDYTSIIDNFKKNGAEILTGVMSPPDFTNFWKQAKQQNLNPKVCGIGKALLFPQTADALGPLADGLSTTVWWHPTYPFKSPLTGETCQEFADNYEKKSGKQWTQPLLHFLVFEWCVDVLKRAKNLDDKNTIMDAVRTTKVTTIDGELDFTQEVGAKGGTRPVPNVVRTPLAGGQWLKSPKFNYDITLCSNANWPMIPVKGTLKPLGA